LTICSVRRLTSWAVTTKPRLYSTATWKPRRTLIENLGTLAEGEKVTIAGWHCQERSFRDFSFSFLRDATGSVQVVWANDMKNSFNPESVLAIKGRVRRRGEEQTNDNLAGGDIEIVAEAVEVVNEATADLPLTPNLFHVTSEEAKKSLEKYLPSEELRLSHRYLDLRRQSQLQILRQRACIQRNIRNYFNDLGFVEVETPLLFKSTPEGAKEFVVPATSLSQKRGGKGAFYALPQSPQQYKQLLMAAGVERYFQIARCFRDEASRADRQPEFTQVDMEASFLSREQIMNVMSGALMSAARAVGKETAISGISCCAEDGTSGLFSNVSDDISLHRVLTYEEVMSQYGIDKPDLRIAFPLLKNVTKMVSSWENNIPFLNAMKSAEGCPSFENSPFSRYQPGVIAVVLPTAGRWSRSKVEALKKLAGLSDFKDVYSSFFSILKRGSWKGGLSKHTSVGERESLEEAIQGSEGDLVGLFACNHLEKAQTIAGRLRSSASIMMDPDSSWKSRATCLEALWVVDFPLFRLAEEDGLAAFEGREWEPSHHPFTSPADTDVPNFWRALGKKEYESGEEHSNSLPANALGHILEGQSINTSYSSLLEGLTSQHYDLVLNGCELGGGSVRIFCPHMQRAMFNVLGIDNGSTAFSHLLSALSSGCPPHAGMALGFDRMMSILLNTSSIRDVIPFPKASSGTDPMTGAPSRLSKKVEEYLKQVL